MTDVRRFALSCSLFRTYSAIYSVDLLAQATLAGQVRVLRLYRDEIREIKLTTDEITDLKLLGLKGAMSAFYLLLNEAAKDVTDSSMMVAATESVGSVDRVCARQGY